MGKDSIEIPLVSITFPIHKFIDEAEIALQSLLAQDYPKTEILFLDNSRSGLKRYFDLKDERIKYHKLPEELGLAETLNYAMAVAGGKYLARMDYDDVALPSRISEQVKFMEENPEIAISGTFISIIGDSIDKKVLPGEIVKRAVVHEEIELKLLTNNAFFHPTVIFRLSEMRKKALRYQAKYNSAEDLDLWIRASRVVRLANLEKVLLQYRLHPNQYSRLDGETSSYIANKVRIFHTLWLLRKGRIDYLVGSKILLKLCLKFLVLWHKKKRTKFDKFT